MADDSESTGPRFKVPSSDAAGQFCSGVSPSIAEGFSECIGVDEFAGDDVPYEETNAVMRRNTSGADNIGLSAVVVVEELECKALDEEADGCEL